MEHQDVNAILEHLTEQAKKKMRRGRGILEPQVFFVILYPGQSTPVYYPLPSASAFFQSPAMKTMLPNYCQMSWDSKKAIAPKGIELKAVCMVGDTYVADYEGSATIEQLKEAYKKCPPANRPDRKEAVSISVCFPDESRLYSFFYKRKPSGDIEYLDSMDDVPAVYGTMTNLFPKRL